MKLTNIFAATSICLCAVFFVAVTMGKVNERVKNTTESTNESTATASETSQQDISSATEQEKEVVLYDTAPISNAYLTGNREGLSDFDGEILDRAEEVLEEIITPDMSDFDKELAVHDWIVYNCTYDTGNLSTLGSMTENSDNPYGALINGKSICTGYTTTFQLFMEMLGIECRSIYATADGGEAHAWNEVCLDGEWYCVDVTWDDPVPDSDGRTVIHSYFNVTSEYMRDTGHEWDENDLPEADCYDLAYSTVKRVTVSGYDEFEQAVLESNANGNADTYIEFGEGTGIDFKRKNWTNRIEMYIDKFITANSCNYFNYYLVPTDNGKCLDLVYR